MSTAPENIWIYPESGYYIYQDSPGRSSLYKGVRYVRADLHEAEFARLNPCAHTGYESAPCDICGYPDPQKLIAVLKQDLALNAKLLARQIDLARNAETEAAKLRRLLEACYCGWPKGTLEKDLEALK